MAESNHTPSKRRRIEKSEGSSLSSLSSSLTRAGVGVSSSSSSLAAAAELRSKRSAFLNSLSRDISPPTRRGQTQSTATDTTSPTSSKTTTKAAPSAIPDPKPSSIPISKAKPTPTPTSKTQVEAQHRGIRSPIQLTQIHSLPASDNIDTVKLSDILGDPLIRTAWIFNFCFDVDWVMSQFDADVRDLVEVKIVHGSWRSEDGNRIGIEQACERRRVRLESQGVKESNVHAVAAYLPDPFGTHHSKMFVLFRHDDTAQVVIHTANMIQKDWTNMTQAVWRSPLLPLLPSSSSSLSLSSLSSSSSSSSSSLSAKETKKGRGAIDLETGSGSGSKLTSGSGEQFKIDLLRYLKAYGTKLRPLTKELESYDFKSVRGTLVASVPSKFKVTDPEVWGHVALRRAVQGIDQEKSRAKGNRSSHLVCQVSSIASLPATWLKDTIVSAAQVSNDASAPAADSGSKSSKSVADTGLSIVFPTAPDIAQSLDGYMSGGSIHTKAQSAAHLKQIEALRPHLCRWTQNRSSTATRAGRHLAAPHIKTYISFEREPSAENPRPDIHWALVTSANLSTQAWGSVPKASKSNVGKRTLDSPEDGIVHIQSFEIGVLVWPELYADECGGNEDGNSVKGGENEKVRMVPVFGRDRPEQKDVKERGKVVGFRMPYDLPLTSYGKADLPWSMHSVHMQKDRHGRTWPPAEMLGLDDS